MISPRPLIFGERETFDGLIAYTLDMENTFDIPRATTKFSTEPREADSSMEEMDCQYREMVKLLNSANYGTYPMETNNKRRYVGNGGKPRESRWAREWLASYNQQVAWKYEKYDPERTEYRPKAEDRDGDECWQCSTPLVDKFNMCCKHASSECGCYGMPVEPPFCSKECHIAFIENWKGKD